MVKLARPGKRPPTEHRNPQTRGGSNESNAVRPRGSREVRGVAKRGVGSKGRGELGRLGRTIDERLRREPLTFGEVYRSRGPVEERLAVHQFLALDIAVDKARRFVLVRKCRALSGH